jgi:plasmid stabilization system protein ParE
MKPVRVQRLAQQDLFDAIDYCVDHAPHVVDRFMLAVDRAMATIGRRPRTGSPGFSEVLDIPDLRYQTVKSFPYAIFYQEFQTEVPVLRVLHHGRDVMSLIGIAEDE